MYKPTMNSFKYILSKLQYFRGKKDKNNSGFDRSWTHAFEAMDKGYTQLT